MDIIEVSNAEKCKKVKKILKEWAGGSDDVYDANGMKKQKEENET